MTAMDFCLSERERLQRSYPSATICFVLSLLLALTVVGILVLPFLWMHFITECIRYSTEIAAISTAIAIRNLTKGD